jgi:hypothetical protein
MLLLSFAGYRAGGLGQAKLDLKPVAHRDIVGLRIGADACGRDGRRFPLSASGGAEFLALNRSLNEPCRTSGFAG